MVESPEYDLLRPSQEDALAAWARRVSRNREQAEKFREAPERPDFYAATAPIFKTDPHHKGDAALEILKGMARPEDTWLDIGAGAGRNALPLARLVREVIAVEPSQAMRKNLLQGMEENGTGNIRIVDARWPMKEAPQADVVLISHVGYDIENLGPFLDGMEASARKMCVAVMLDSAPSSSVDLFWPRIHGEKRVPLPSLRDFLVVQLSRGQLCEVRLATREVISYSNRQMVLNFLRQQLFIEPDGQKDRLLQQIMNELLTERDGRYGFNWKPGTLGIVSWEPK
jgi:SAM-dependent methyltransferase